MGAEQHIEARSRVKAYLRWKHLESTDPAMSYEGRAAVLQALCADGPAAIGDFIEAMAGNSINMLNVICEDDQREVAETIDGMIVSDAHAAEVLGE